MTNAPVLTYGFAENENRVVSGNKIKIRFFGFYADGQFSVLLPPRTDSSDLEHTNTPSGITELADGSFYVCNSINARQRRRRRRTLTAFNVNATTSINQPGNPGDRPG